MVWVFWLSVATIVYVYAGYPCVLYLWKAYRRLRIADCGLDCGLRNAECGLDFGLNPQSAINPQSTNPQSTINPQSAIRNPQYGVSIVIAARNEAARLPARIDNLLSLDYPADRRQIVVVSDGSTDDSIAVLQRYRSAIDVVAVRAGGKALALNAGVAAAK